MYMLINRTDVARVLTKRDGYTREDAEDVMDDIENEMQDYINDGDYEGAIEVLEGYGFEPDYINF